METQQDIYLEADAVLVDYLEADKNFQLNNLPIRSYKNRLEYKDIYKIIQPIKEANVILDVLERNFNIHFVLPDFLPGGVDFNTYVNWHKTHFKFIKNFRFVSGAFKTNSGFAIINPEISLMDFVNTNLKIYGISNPVLDWPGIIYGFYKNENITVKTNHPFMPDVTFKITKRFIKNFPLKLFTNAIQDKKEQQLQDLAKDYCKFRFPEYAKIEEYFLGNNQKKLNKQLKKHNKNREALCLPPLKDANAIFEDKVLQAYCYKQVISFKN